MQVVATLIAEATSNTPRKVFEVREHPINRKFLVYDLGMSGFLFRSESLFRALSHAAQLVNDTLEGK